MKIKINMKNPDCIDAALDEAAQESIDSLEGASDEERADVMASCRDTIARQLSQWVKYGEYITVEIDTELNTAIVCPVK